MRVLVAATLACAALAGPFDLLDNAIAGDAFVSLDGVWALSNGSITINATVPGDIITDLQLGGLLPGDPLYELNFKDAVWENSGNWTYTTSFDAGALGGNPHVLLVFEGIKMVSDIALNGVALGFTADQFLRYTYDVSTALKPAGQANVLTVSFPTVQDARNAEERWMSCSGGWDWAPYSDTSFQGKCSTFSKGIWHGVYLVGSAAGSAAIAHVAPQVYYNGTYPSLPLTDDEHGDFTVAVAVHFIAPASGASGTLSVSGAWAGGAASLPVTLPAGNSTVTATLAAAGSAVKLWWPAQTPGAQTRYAINVSFTPAGGAAVAAAPRRVGFRVFTLVTGNDTDPASLAGKDGQTGFTMRFKVNGADIWSRGANMIPMEEMEGRTDPVALRRLVQSAAEGGFNTFRLWGGGIFQYDAWYEACDDFGILIYHDAMFAQGNHAPAATEMQTDEILHQVRRLSHHPSVAIYDGCNECNGHGIYASFVMTTIAQEDPSRPPWPSCPAHGWASGVDALWGLPNGSPLGLQPQLEDPVRAAAALPCGGGGGSCKAGACTLVPNGDYDHGSMGPLPHPAAASTDACCALCAAEPQCWAAVFAGTMCWMKTQAQTQLNNYSGGVTAVWPAGHGPIPPAPTPPPSPPVNPNCGSVSYETHGYYQHGEGYKTVNSGSGDLQPFSPNVPPAMGGAALTGTSCPGTYASEFGAVAVSSFESLSPTLAPADWGLHNAAMAQRNYALDNFVTSVANTPWPAGFDGVTGKAALQYYTFFAQLGQALWIKSDIEGRRAINSFGCITWQFNEIWPTGGWGSIEYGTVGYTPGQVRGGRWKPLQYFMRRYLYRDALVAASADGRLLVRNDDPFAPLAGNVSVRLAHLATGATTTVVAAAPVSAPRGAAALAWLCADGQHALGACDPWSAILPRAGCAADGSDCIALLRLTDAASGALLADNFELLAPVYALALSTGTIVTAAVAPAPDPDGTVPVSLTVTGGMAAFVTLTTLAQGRFSDNALLLPPGAASVSFLPWGPLDLALLTSSLRVEHVATYGVNATPPHALF